MDIILFILSDWVWLILLQLSIFIFFIISVIREIVARKCPGNPSKEVTRGEKSWNILLFFWTIIIIAFVEIIISSDLIRGYTVFVGLLNLSMLLFINFRSSYFRNKIIGWISKLQQTKEHL